MGEALLHSFLWNIGNFQFAICAIGDDVIHVYACACLHLPLWLLLHWCIMTMTLSVRHIGFLLTTWLRSHLKFLTTWFFISAVLNSCFSSRPSSVSDHVFFFFFNLSQLFWYRSFPSTPSRIFLDRLVSHHLEMKTELPIFPIQNTNQNLSKHGFQISKRKMKLNSSKLPRHQSGSFIRKHNLCNICSTFFPFILLYSLWNRIIYYLINYIIMKALCHHKLLMGNIFT